MEPLRKRIRVETSAKLAAGGDAIARAPDGRVMFVKGGAPNEELEVEIVLENRTFLRAQAIEVVRPSSARVDPPCRYFGTCGGCELQHIASLEQTGQKQAALLETLTRIGHVDLADVAIGEPWAGEPYGYRSRARFAIAPSGSVGFRAAGGREIVDIEECLIASPPIGRALRAIRSMVAGGERARPRSVEEIETVANDDQAVIGTEVLEAADGGEPLLLQPNVFAQANRDGNRAMSTELAALFEGRTVEDLVELYSGSGNFTRVLAPHGLRVRAFESEAAAHALAERTHAPNAEPICLSVEAALERLVAEGRPIDAIVANPPRAGMTPRAAELIGRLAPPLLIYVSCDAATLARDVARLQGHGLFLDRLRLFDLYPQTPHSEVVARATKRPI